MLTGSLAPLLCSQFLLTHALVQLPEVLRIRVTWGERCPTSLRAHRLYQHIQQTSQDCRVEAIKSMHALLGGLIRVIDVELPEAWLLTNAGVEG